MVVAVETLRGWHKKAQVLSKTSREKFSSNGISWFVIPLIQIHVDTFGPFWCFTRELQFVCDYMFLFKIYLTIS